jgi:flavin reductase (DIM6/NTAB) family NADH-FMN oxidoreductase RutF
MDKLNIGTEADIYPMPVALIGSSLRGRANFATAAWLSRICVDPPIMMIAIGKKHFTNAAIRDTRTFSINIPGGDLVTQTDYCGLVSGNDIDKSLLFEVFSGSLEGAPMIAQCPLAMECRVLNIISAYPSDDLFVGQVVATYTEQRFLTRGKPDLRKVNPLLLTGADNHYWMLGEQVAKAFKVGKALKQSKQGAADG